MSSLELSRENLPLLKQKSPSADHRMAAKIVPLPIREKGAERMSQRRGARREPQEIRFEALVATIRQRDAADGRASFWKRAFFMLAWIAGTASVALAVGWMKGRL